MKLLVRLAREASSKKWLLIISMFSTLALTFVNMYQPRVLSDFIELIGGGITEASFSMIWQFTFILLGLYLVKVLFRYLSNYMAHKAAWELVQSIGQKVYNKIQTFSMSYFHDKPTGELTSRIINDVSKFELLYAHLIPEMVTNIIYFVGVSIILFTMNAKLALLTCLPLPFLAYASWFFAKKVRPSFRLRSRAEAQLLAQLQDNFSGMQEIQAFVQQEKASEKVSSRYDVFTTSMLNALNLSAIFHPSVEFLVNLGSIAVVAFGGFLAFRGELSVSDIVAFMLYINLFYTPVTNAAQLLENAQQCIAGVERVVEVLDTQSEIEDLPGAKPIENVKGKVEFSDVSFSYTEDKSVLSDIDFTIEPGQMVALVGPTGVGKTTLVQLIARFYDPVKGKVMIDGQDIKYATLESLRSSISYVLQDTFLFNGTVYENIAYANNRATMEEIIEAAKAARIHDDILSMPMGYDTPVGERGTKLSGGQKQRIAIARAILRNSPILILDEATASVDTETEKHIQDAINNLAGTRTIFAIAHRLSTVKRADVIFVFEEGRIIQRGTHEELSQQEGLYKRLCTVQGEGTPLNIGDIG
ncbi:MAG: ABC transporter ATP-binding protein [Christensenellaceae bacterium]|nr:ABC transporter ATP-binding protein [Christensenellaceae bacterium]